MCERGPDGLPTGRLVSVPDGPLDDCLTDLAGPPVLRWPGGPTLTLTSSFDHWVVYTEPTHALCVEPQSGPPDAFHHEPTVVRPGHPLRGWAHLGWG